MNNISKYIILLLSLCSTFFFFSVSAFTFTNFYSSNETGRLIGSAIQTAGGTRSGGRLAGAYMLAFVEFSTSGTLDTSSTILIDGYTGNIINLSGNNYRARVQMPGDNGADRFIGVSVPFWSAGGSTGSFPTSTGIAGKFIYYLPNTGTYWNISPTRCGVSDMGSLGIISGTAYSGTISSVERMKVYCHNIPIRVTLLGTGTTGTSYSYPLFTGVRSYINPNHTGLNLPTDLWAYYKQVAFNTPITGLSLGLRDTTQFADGRYTLSYIILNTAYNPAALAPRRSATIIIDNTPPTITLLSTGSTYSGSTLTLSGSESLTRSHSLSTTCGGSGLQILTGSTGVVNTGSFWGLTPSTSYCITSTGVDQAGRTTGRQTLITTAPAPLSVSIISTGTTTGSMTAVLSGSTGASWTGVLALTCGGTGLQTMTGGFGTGFSPIYTGLSSSTSYCMTITATEVGGYVVTTGITLTTLAPTPPALSVISTGVSTGSASIVMSGSVPVSRSATIALTCGGTGLQTLTGNTGLIFTGGFTGLTGGMSYCITISANDGVSTVNTTVALITTTPTVVTPPSGGGPAPSGGGSAGGGGGGSLRPDSCPDGDYSPSYYDGTCGTNIPKPTDPKPIQPQPTLTQDPVGSAQCFDGKSLTSAQRRLRNTINRTIRIQTFDLTIDEQKDFLQTRHTKLLMNTGSNMNFARYLLQYHIDRVDFWNEVDTQQLYPDDIIDWLHSYQIRFADSVESLQLQAPLSREQAADMYLQYAKRVLCLAPVRTAAQCQFTDLDQADPTLRDSIVQSCMYNIFRGYTPEIFGPKDPLLDKQAITALTRLIYGQQVATNGDMWRDPFVRRAVQHDIIDTAPSASVQTNATYSDVATMMIRSFFAR